MIYVSCNPDAARKNFFDLGRPESKTLKGEPFVPVRAVPVDMFPHTKHCELVILFERFDVVKEREEKLKQENEAQNIEDTEIKLEPEESCKTENEDIVVKLEESENNEETERNVETAMTSEEVDSKKDNEISLDNKDV